MEFGQLQSFCAVVDCRSFTKAAEQLGISQPTISTHVRQLEEELQTQLIRRTTKSLEITPSGKEFLEFARHMLATRDSLVTRWAGENRGTVTLGASSIPSAYVLPEVLPAFREAFPDTRFVINQSDSRFVIDSVLNGASEIGLAGMRIDDDSLGFIPFYHDTMVLITPANERFAELKARGPLRLEDFTGEPFILREQGSGSEKCTRDYLEGMGVFEDDLQVTARLNDQESIKRLVVCGLGVAIVSEKVAHDTCESGRLIAFDLPGNPASRDLYIVHRQSNPLKERTAQFVEFVRDFYAAE